MIKSQTRRFFFLRDGPNGGFYTGQQNSIMDFKNAAVYYKQENAKKKMGDIVSSWEHQERYMDKWIKDTQDRERYDDKDREQFAQEKKDVIKRKNLDNWGIKIVWSDVDI